MRHSNVISSYLVLIDNDRILLSKRKNTGYRDGYYGLVAGHVEAGETFTEGMIREADEEAGIRLNSEDIQVTHVLHRKSGTDGSERVDVFFVAKQWSGDIQNKEPEKCAGLDWFMLDNLPEKLVPCVCQAIECIQKNIFYSEYGWEL